MTPRIKDTLARAAKTAVQTFVAAVAVGIAGVTDVNTAKALAFSALTAAVSVAWNTVVKPALP